MVELGERRLVDMLLGYEVLILVWWCDLDIVLFAREIAGDGGRKHLVYTERVWGRWKKCYENDLIQYHLIYIKKE